MENIKVSVIVPVYNVEIYLKDCLESLCHQTLPNIEIIIVNDGSTDNSESIIRNYENEYPCITVIEQQNKGLSVARNTGIKYATGKYIVFVDSDDFVDLDFCEQLFIKAEKYSCPLVICGVQLYWNNRKKKAYKRTRFDEDRIYDKDSLYKLLLDQDRGIGCQVWNKIYDRQILMNSGIRFQENKYYEDIVFTFKIVELYGQAMFINCLKYHYRMRENSIVSAVSEKKIIDYIDNCSEAINFIRRHSKDIYQKYKIVTFTSIKIYVYELSKSLSANQRYILNQYLNKSYPLNFSLHKILISSQISFKKKFKYLFYTFQNIYKC